MYGVGIDFLLHSFPVAVSVEMPEGSLNSVICVTFELDWNFKEERTRAKYRVGESEDVRIRILEPKMFRKKSGKE